MPIPALGLDQCQHGIDFSSASTVWPVWSMYSNLSKKDVIDNSLREMVETVKKFDDNNNLSAIEAS